MKEYVHSAILLYTSCCRGCENLVGGRILVARGLRGLVRNAKNLISQTSGTHGHALTDIGDVWVLHSVCLAL